MNRRLELHNLRQMSTTWAVTKTLQGVRLLSSAIRQDILRAMALCYPFKPIMVRFLCTGDQDPKIEREELSKLLATPLFSKIKHVNLSVNEMVSYHDILDMGYSFTKSLPKLKCINLFVNVSSHQVVIPRILASVKSIQESGIRFSVSIALENVVDISIHEQNWQDVLTAIAEAIKTLEQSDIQVSVNYTLTPLNCYEADDVLLWCEQNGIRDWAFRMGVEGKHFDNDGYSQKHPFTTEQRFHVTMFFDNLARHAELDLPRRMYYKSLADQLSFGVQRTANCDWQTRAVTLDMQGRLSHCPPQGPIWGSIMAKSALQTYRQGNPERRKIIRDHCDSCQYDSIGYLTTAQIVKRATDVLNSQWRKKTKRTPDQSIAIRSIQPGDHNSPQDWRRVLITGWYGTETTGDKAILGEVLHFVKQRSPDCEIILTTLDKRISRQTNLELEDLTGVTLVDIENGCKPALIESVDAVIVAGGPLMQTAAMEYIWRIFSEANRQRKARVIFGCGVGPLHSEEMRHMTGQVLQMSTAGFLRDEESYEYALKLAPDTKFGIACDPALAYLKRWLAANGSMPLQAEPSMQIATLLRANTKEFIVATAKKELEDFNHQVALKISRILETVCVARSARTVLLAMNAPWIGGDDRMFNRLVADSFTRPELVHVERGYFTLNAIIKSLVGSAASIVMRYHGHLFCMALGIPFLSIDYTGQSGKVHSLVKRIGYEKWSQPWREIDIEHSARRLEDLLCERVYWSEYLVQQSDGLVNQLQSTYSEVFGEFPELS